MTAGFDRARVTAIVLAGGRSHRFGADKLATTVDGVTLLGRAVNAVESVAGQILIAGRGQPGVGSSADVPGGSNPPIRVIADVEPFAGPLAALAGALRQTSTESAIVVGGDMPRLVPAVLRSMLDRLRVNAAVDGVLLESRPRFDQPATAGTDASARRQVLPVALRIGPATTAATAAIAAGDRSLAGFLDRIRVLEVPAEDWLRLDPMGDSTFDIDLPDDLERFRDRENR